METILHILGICGDANSHIDITDLILSNHSEVHGLQRILFTMHRVAKITWDVLKIMI